MTWRVRVTVETVTVRRTTVGAGEEVLVEAGVEPMRAASFCFCAGWRF